MGLISKKEIGDFEGIIKGFDDVANAAVKSSETIKESFGSLQISANSNVDINNKLIKTVDDLKKITDKLTKTVTKNTTAKKKNKKATTEEEKLTRKLAASEERLNLVESKQNKLLQTNTALINQQNAAIRKQVTGNKGLLSTLKGMTLSLRNLAVAYFGFQTLIRGVKDIFNITKALDSIDFSQRKVIKSAVEFAQTQVWLSGIINDYGLDLVTVTNRYTKFRAATISSNLSALETQKIFGSMSKAAATLGLKTDELQGVYLALEQMISKNKVTTEELRRQLGERLPGAFDIMAKSMDVSTNKLNKMLKAGVVMSEEVLPKFAEEVEKAYGIQSVKFVDTLVAAQNRLKTAWIELIRILDASNAFKDFFNTMASGLRWIGDNLNIVVKLTKAVGLAIAAYAAWRIGLIATTIATRGLTISTLQLGKALKKNPIGFLAAGILTALSAIEIFNAAMGETEETTKSFSQAISEEKKRVDLLFGSLQNAEEGTSEWLNAKLEINRLYGTYIPNLITEESTVNDIAEAYKAASIQAQGFAAIKIKEEKILEASTKNQLAENKAKETLSDLLIANGKSATEAGIAQAKLLDIISVGIKESGGLNKVLDDLGITVRDLGEKGYEKARNALIGYNRESNNLNRVTKRETELLEGLLKALGFVKDELGDDTGFNVENFEKNLTVASKKFTDFVKLVSDDTKKEFSDTNKFVLDETKKTYSLENFKSYKDFLNNLLVEYKDNVNARILIEQELFKVNKKGRNIRLQTQRELNKQLLAEEKTFLEQQKSESIKALLEQGKSKSQISQFIQDVDSENRIILLNSARTLNENLLAFAGDNAKDIAKIKADGAKLEAGIAKEKVDNEITQIKRGIDETERLRDQQVITDIDRVQKQFKFAADKLIEQLRNREITSGEFQLKYEAIERDTQRQILQIQLDAEKKKLLLLEIGTIEYENSRKKIIAFEKTLNDGVTKENKTFADSWIENREAIRDKSIELINEVFNFQMQSLENQKTAITALRDFEVALAGSNLEEKIKAERKFEKEELKIRQRQARAQKAQAAFNIITSTAAAIAKTLEITGFFGIPLTILVAAIGALQLATVLSQPIPKFEMGGKHKGGPAEFDEGNKSEIFIPEKGNPILTSGIHTIANMPAGEFIPHNETQMILAQGVTETAYGGISMSKSEGYLKDIRDKETTTYVDGYKIVTRKNFIGRYRCS